MNLTPARAALTALALAGALSFSGCGAVDDAKDKSTEFPAQVEKNFVSACVSSGGDQATCQCSFDAIEKSMTIEEFSKAEEAMDGINLPPEFETAIRSCVDTDG